MSAETEEAMLRPMLPADVPVLAAIFQAAIDELAGEDYDENPRLAWSAAADDEATFDEAFDSLAASLSENTARYLQTA